MNPFYRVDNRLVHGQIIATWMPHLRLNRVVILSDTVPDNGLQMDMFRMCLPPQLAFDALPIKTGARWLSQRSFGADRTLVLLESTEDAERLFEAGHPFSALNLGNVHHTEGSTAFTSAVYLNEDQIGQIGRLIQRGAQVSIQSLPTDTPIDLKHALEARAS